MAEYSKSVKRGLEQMHEAQGAQLHPDPDLLTAFAEQSLTKRERESVLAHLASCAECRDVVALSLPEQVALQPQAEPVKPMFWRWPVLRWGAVAASMVVVAIAVSIGNMQHNQAVQELKIAHSDAAPVAAASAPPTMQNNAEVAKELEAPVPAGVQRQKIRYEKVPDASAQNAPLKRDQKRNDSRVASGALSKDAGAEVAGSGLVARDEVKPTKSAQTADNAVRADQVQDKTWIVAGLPQKTAQQQAAPVPPPPPPTANVAPQSANETVDVQSSAAMLDTAKEQRAVHGAMAAAAKEKKSEESPKIMYQMPAQQSSSLRKTMRFEAPTNWHVSSAGALERSYDGGQTWERALPNANFRAVAAIGNEIWAGGVDSLLMHSTDGGQTWATVTPGIKGDVTGLQFADAKNGVVKTSSNETWQTVDGGKSWKKQ